MNGKLTLWSRCSAIATANHESVNSPLSREHFITSILFHVVSMYHNKIMYVNLLLLSEPTPGISMADDLNFLPRHWQQKKKRSVIIIKFIVANKNKEFFMECEIIIFGFSRFSRARYSFNLFTLDRDLRTFSGNILKSYFR